MKKILLPLLLLGAVASLHAQLCWQQLGIDIDGEAAGDRSGYSVSISADGNTLAVGANLNDGNGADAGQVRVYHYNGVAWVQVGADIDGEAADDQSGWSVSLSADGNTVAIGAPYNDDNGSETGQVRVYHYNGLAWVQVGDDIDGETALDYSGRSVSLSADGNTLAIGAPATFNNAAAGQVQVYHYNGAAWEQVGADIDGEAASDNSGWSVSLSADGNKMAIGAPQNDGNGNNAGQARVYEINCVFCTATLSGNAAICPGESTTITINVTGNSGFFLPAIDINGDMIADYVNNGFSGSLEIPVAPGITTTYTLLSVLDGLNNKQCEISNPSVTVTIKPLPELTPQELDFCAGQPVDLTASEDQISAETGTFQYFKQGALDRLYITNSGSNNVSVVDIMTNTVIATIPVLGNPIGVSVSPSGDRVYIINSDEDIISDITVIDAATNQIATHIYTGTSPFGICVSPSGDQLYITNQVNNNVSVIDATSNLVTQTISVGNSPIGISVSPSGDRVYVTNSTSNTVSVIDATTNMVISTIAVGNAPIGVSVNPAGDRVYITNENDNTVSVIDAITNMVISTIAVGNAPTGISVNPDGAWVYVVNIEDNTISVIDVTTNMVTTTISVGNEPFGISVNASGDRIYVTNVTDGTVSVIDATTNMVIATIPVGDQPVSLGNFYAQAPMLIDVPTNYQPQDGEEILVNFTSDATGCFAQTTITFDELPTPAASVSVETSPICAGQDAVFNLTGTPNAEVTYNINDGSNQMTALNASGEATITINGATASQILNLVSVTLNTCSQNLSGNATIVVNDVAAGAIGGDQTICASDDPAAFTSVTDGSGSGNITYRWGNSTTGCDANDFVVIDGATNATYDAPSLTQTTYFHRISISTLNDVACEAISKCITVIVNDVAAGAIGGDQTICAGDDPAVFTSVTDGSGSGNITYRWENSTTGCDANDFMVIAEATNATYNAPNLTQTTYFHRISISTLNDVACEAISNCITVIVNDVAAGAIGGDQTISSGGDPVAFTSEADGSGAGTLTYRWEMSTISCNAGFTAIDGAINATYDAPNLIQTTYFHRVTISTLNDIVCEAISNCVTVTVNYIDPGEIGGGQTVCKTKDPSPFTSVIAATGSGTITYQWEVSTINCDTGFTPIDGATAAMFDPTKGQFKVTSYFRRRAISTLNEVSSEAVSNCITLTVLNVDCGAFPWNGN